MMVGDIIHHPQVRELQHSVSSDVSLVSLLQPFTLSTEGVGAACLPVSQSELEECRVVGWSSPQVGLSFSQEVSEVTERLVSPDLCNSTAGYNGHLPPNTLCVDSIGCAVSGYFVLYYTVLYCTVVYCSVLY